MSDGWLRSGIFRAEPGGDLPAFSVTRLPPELAERQSLQRAVLRGEPGFGESEPDLVAGSVTGYRWWALDAGGRLLGMHAAWEPGENTAVCLLGDASPHPASRVVTKGCHCGFCAFWTVRPGYSTGSLIPVLGVIEGYGRVRTGTKGFRCGKARILALHAPGDDTPAHFAAGLLMAANYPAARVYRSLDAMAGEFPPDPYYCG